MRACTAGLAPSDRLPHRYPETRDSEDVHRYPRVNGLIPSGATPNRSPLLHMLTAANVQMLWARDDEIVSIGGLLTERWLHRREC
jgi:hypothetical protein